MGKIKLKRKIKKKNIFFIILTLLLISLIIVFKIFNKYAKPVFITYAKSETKKLATLIINSAVSKQVSENLTVDNLFNITNDNEGNITSINFNSVIVNKVLTTTTNSTALNLKYIQNGQIDLLEIPEDVLVSYDEEKLKKGIIYEMPFGVIFNNSLLTNISPKIPVRLNLIGDIISQIDTKITNYGINNALIEIYIKLEVTLKVILPFVSDDVTVKTSVPVAMKVVQGSVPEYYSNGDLSSSSLSIPIE